MSDLIARLVDVESMDLRTGPIPAHTIDTVGEARAEIARLRAENANLDERMRNWMRIADERAVQVGTLKVERDRLRAALHWIESSGR